MTTDRRVGNASWIVVVACGVIAAMHVWKLPTALGEVRADLSIDLVQAGLLLGLVQVAGMVGSLPVSLIGERIGLRRAMSTGLGLLGVGSVISAFSPTAAALMAARILEGLGFILVTVMAPPLIRRDTPRRTLTIALGFWTAFMGTATFLALLTSSLLLQAVDWQSWYLFMAALTALGIPLLFRYVPRDPLSEVNVGAAFRRAWLTATSWKPWIAGLVFVSYSIQWSAVIGFLPTIYEGYGIDPVLGGVLSAVAGGVNAIGAVYGGVLLHRGFSVRPLVVIAFTVMGFSAFAFYALDWPQLPGTFASQFLLVCLFSFTGAFIPTAIYRIAVEIAPPGGSPPAVIGVLQQMQNTGAFFGPAILAWLATQAGGWGSSWWLCAAASVLGVGLIQLFSENDWASRRAVDPGNHGNPVHLDRVPNCGA
ncbi:MFS transporter [Corynebacterium guangdongense]|uniref:MFS transporter n=1 Tax=Corynebacterium guangdongense TaxID=1783348 RepID=UPI0025B31C2A|nr:MFS transporter [Corynebacterium guangdongense]